MNTKFIHLTLSALLALAIIGCGGSKKDESSAPAPAASAPAAGKSVDAATAGSVTGTVTLDGKAPAAKPPPRHGAGKRPVSATSSASPAIVNELVTPMPLCFAASPRRLLG